MRIVFILAFMLIASGAHAQPCKPSATFVQDKAQPIPDGFTSKDKAVLLTSDGKPFPGGGVTINPNNTFEVSAAATALAAGLTLRWTNAGGATCDQKHEAGSGVLPAVSSTLVSQCVRAGAAAAVQVRNAYRGNENYLVMLLSDDGVCYASKHFSTEGDSLFIGYAREHGAPAVLEFDKCEAASAIPKVLASDLSQIKPESGRAPRFDVQWFVPVPQCFGASVELHLNKAGAPKFVSTQITQYERYRATLQLGAVFSKKHIESFGLAPIGGKQVLVSKGPDADRAPEYTASVVIYAFPRYLYRRRVSDPPFLPAAGTATERKVPYFGREPVHETGAIDRLGAMFGVGMSQPGRRFVTAVTFEIFTGVNVFAGGEFVKLIKLNGYEPGQEFTGAADAIPLRDKWERGTMIGMSFDGRYATALFAKK
jgi:hypothetical protein